MHQKREKQCRAKWSFAVLFMLLGTWAQAQTSVPKVFGNNMILQRDTDIPVWGKAAPGTQLTVALHNSRVATTANAQGGWSVRLPRMQAGGPYTLSVFEANNTKPALHFANVLIGDVWLASGQSNMEWQVQQAKDANAEIARANYPNIRLFKVPHSKKITPQTDMANAAWMVCDSLNVKNISAVAYYFARELHTDLNVPVGILQTTWGGTPVEAWTSREQLMASPETRLRLLANDTLTEQHFVQDSLDLVRFWDIVYQAKNNTVERIAAKKFDDSAWPILEMPKTFGHWEMPFYQGMVWMRKSMELPRSMVGKELTINLGQPEMNYSLYVNGKEICKTVWNAEPTHRYVLPANLLHQGSNSIAVRIAVLWGGGGFNPPADSMFVTDGQKRISLAGPWKYRKDLEPRIPAIQNYHQYPAYLFNGMVNPIVPYAIKGFIWYQGENNEDAPLAYRSLFPQLITDWRIRWQQGYLPFLYVQLANYRKVQPQPALSNWALLREAQAMTLARPNTGMACIIDLGEADNIHPKNKQAVGHRLSLLAKKLAYQQTVQCSGPMYASHRINGAQVKLSFSETGKGLAVSGGGTLKGFALAGADKKFYWANAHLKGDTVIVSANSVPHPVAVRYAWANNPVCNLINQDGLPAVPFRTDDWDALEEKK